MNVGSVFDVIKNFRVVLFVSGSILIVIVLIISWLVKGKIEELVEKEVKDEIEKVLNTYKGKK
jgi:hypothetical protein